MTGVFTQVLQLVRSTLGDIFSNCYYISLAIALVLLMSLVCSIIYWLLGRM